MRELVFSKMYRFLEQVWTDVSQRTVLYPYEAGILVLAIALFSILGTGPMRGAARVYQHLASRRRLCITFVFVLGYMGHRVEPGYVLPPPGFHDEFSYLLAADTFASGRITNPPHPMGYFFESIHILREPTYMSMYPPGQGLMLAAGILLGGDPIIGVWLSTALLCAGICWMLQGWTTPGWALTGALISVARIGWFSYWAHSYWGGSVAAFGGVLLMGTVPRLVRQPTRVLGCVFALGTLILVNTRLLEGTALAVTTVIWLGLRLKGRLKMPLWKWLSRFAVPAVLLVVAGFGCMCFYNWRVTGAPLRLPYLENRDRYEIHPTFFWQPSVTERDYDHDVIRRFYTETEGYIRLHPFWYAQLEKVETAWLFFVGPALTLPLLFAVLSIPGGRLRLAWLALATFFAVHLSVQWRLQPHYAATVTGAAYILFVEGLRRLGIGWRRNRHFGLQTQRAVLATCAVMALIRVAAPSTGIPVFKEQTMPWYSYGLGANFARSRMEEKLTKLGGKHLVLVQYSPRHSPEAEWVYNRADIDASSVVWARHVADRARLQGLLDYYRDRHVWIIFPDDKPNQIFDFERK